MISRETAYQQIDDERQRMQEERLDDERPLQFWANAIYYRFTDLQAAVINDTPERALVALREMAAYAVAALENHGKEEA